MRLWNARRLPSSRFLSHPGYRCRSVIRRRVDVREEPFILAAHGEFANAHAPSGCMKRFVTAAERLGSFAQERGAIVERSKWFETLVRFARMHRDNGFVTMLPRVG